MAEFRKCEKELKEKGVCVDRSSLIFVDLQRYIIGDDYEGFWNYITDGDGLKEKESRKELFEAIRKLAMTKW